jgi:mono/diheme cytochrome c family protein
MLKVTVRCLLLAGGLLHAGAAVGAQGPPQSPRPSLTASVAGADSFELYCAPCHGSKGLGDGPVAPALRTRPADLTTLAQRSGGVYPRDRVFDFVSGTGRTLAAHGTTEMPIWGGLFRAFEADAVARQRMLNVVAHIETLQAPAPAAADPGGRLYRTHCASCHGADARGDGPVAAELRRRPSDLTKFAMRNGGVFPADRLREIIDGRHVTSHGERDMPIWGDVFRYRGGDGDKRSITERIEAIVRYLAAIQERRG